jgi:hypothetical protein
VPPIIWQNACYPLVVNPALPDDAHHVQGRRTDDHRFRCARLRDQQLVRVVRGEVGGDGVQQPAIRERLLVEGAEPVGNTPDQFRAFIDAEIAKWGKIIRGAGLTAS